MSVADKLLQVKQVKQNIKTAIETKGIPMTDIAFTEYANKILDISGGGGVVDEYFYYSKAYYTITNNSTLFENAWQDMKDLELFDIPLMLAAPNQEMSGMTIDLYVGTNGQLQALYDACANGTIPPGDDYYVNNVAIRYNGDVSGLVSFPIPLYSFGSFFGFPDNTSFLVGDLTPLEMGLGLVLAKNVNVSIPNNNIVIQKDFEFENENGIIIPHNFTSIGDKAFYDWRFYNKPLVIPNSVTSIGDEAFAYWPSNNQPLVIPNSVTSIGTNAFYNWTSNNQPLVIPNSVTSIGNYAFWNWTSNNQPLVIPNSVTSIESYAFSNWVLVPYVEMQSLTPPTLTNIRAFDGQNDAPIYVPDESVDDYKTATNWVDLADRIFSINDLASGGGGEVDEYFNYAKDYYTATNNATLFENAWQDMKDSKTVLFDIPLTLAAPNQEMEGMTIDLYVGTDGQLQALYDACANETVTPLDVYYVNNVATLYTGDVRDFFGFPVPIYMFGNVIDGNDNASFVICDLTPLSMGLGLVLIKNVNVSIPNNNIVIQQGFERENESGIIIPNSVTSIGSSAFWDWNSNNQPLVIPDSVTSIEDNAFDNWASNNQPLVIPDSVTSIEQYAFANWQSNNQPLVIPESVTSIEDYAFRDWSSNNQPLVIPDSITSIGNSAFSDWESNNQPLVIPNSVTSIGNYAFYNWQSNNQPLVIPNSVTSIGDDAFRNWSSNNQPLVIPDSITSIGNSAFSDWQSNNHPLIIPNSVTSIESYAFQNWEANNHPLVIPDSVTSIETYAFSNWEANNHPLVIPDSVTSIGNYAFSNWEAVPYVEMQATTPPTLTNIRAFDGQNDAPIYVPDESVDDYKTATNWVDLADRIFSINDK